MSKRFYLHCDLKEGATNKYYCAFCDLFVEESHFYSEHEDKNDYERFTRDLKNWKARKKLGTKLIRPANAPNRL